MPLLIAVAASIAVGCGATPSPSAEPSGGEVVRVVDGDTLIVRIGGDEERVRLLGVDTPEAARDGSPAECGADAASANLARLARAGARARVVTDPGTGDVRDRYDRLLAFVSVGGRDLGLAQVRRGWAEVFAFRDRRFTRRDRYEDAYEDAADRGAGVHGRC